MKIGDLAKRSGLSPSRIRFYESVGLLPAVRRQENGYRSYPPEALQVLELIATAQQSGFSLDEIRALLPADMTAWDHAAVVGALRRKVAEIESLEARLAASKAQLAALLAEIEAKPDDVVCADNARRVLSRLLGGETPSP